MLVSLVCVNIMCKGMLKSFGEIFGMRFTSVSINGSLFNGVVNVPRRRISLCEAVKCSFSIPVRMDRSNLGCPGAARSMGFIADDAGIAAEISRNGGVNEEWAHKIISGIPVLDNIRHIDLGLHTCGQVNGNDMYVVYMHPGKFTRLLLLLAKIEIVPRIANQVFLSVCGSVIARTISDNSVSVSFGCPDSRRVGGNR